MRIFLSFIVIVLIINLGLVKRDPIITIVDIGENNRIELGKQLRIIKKYSPRVIALDFYLVPDSLDQDTVLVKELATIKNTVQVVGLRDFYKPDYIWDDLEVSHSKFNVLNHGFGNLTLEDSILVKELPMQQLLNSKYIYSFSYAIAENSFGVKHKFRDTADRKLKLKMRGLGMNYKLITSDELLTGKIKKEDLNDKIVIMGYIGDKEDYFYVDEHKSRKVNGVEVHAAIVDEIIDL
ncbi:MAG TPA: CHASE2 domain-containing protein [Cyclobacteriaceae bacterium]|jgi:CHASE2 domain-containing sensor protein|nr:CHASE2 domain-containing protein [Cyclobacteriaceae bacterium]